MGHFRDLHSVLEPLTFNIEEDPEVTRPGLRKYLQFYSIDFSKRHDINHRLGKISAAGFSIATHYWTLEDARGTVFVFHGYLDHVGLFGHVIRWCLKEHYNVVAIDFPGHGLSTGKQASIDNFDKYGEVLQTLVSQCNNRFLKPYYCIAQCTGAAAVMNMMWKHKRHPFAKMIFLAPSVRPQDWSKRKFRYYLTRNIFSSTKRRFVTNTADKRFLLFVSKKDPLQAKRLPVKWVTAMKKWTDQFPSMPKEIVNPLILQGDKDITADWQYNIKQVRAHFPNGKIEFLRGANHHLANEVQKIRKNMFSRIKSYLDVHEI